MIFMVIGKVMLGEDVPVSQERVIFVLTIMDRERSRQWHRTHVLPTEQNGGGEN